MAVKEAAKEVGKGLAWGSPGIMATILDKLAHLALSDFVTLATLIYTTILILRQIPKCIGCIRCFLKNRTCTNVCKG